MSKEKFYMTERNIQIVLSLLKANGIRKIIASPVHTSRGVVPISKTTKPSRIVDNITCLSLKLENEDVVKISKLNQDYKLIVESIACPGF
ncbi:hypothetical protein [Bacteroides thetaiotaomicron]|uniref:hypothetical protein n=1 Tax=Bacteroides thetaiotaomicron TaxID=818 RepID=UPI001F2699CC|nr:hypothetical protein [Bacteroides thetaiotaomicron]MCE8780661.1 hypothetical protein [Bacteroides thetaiotaomicron]